MTRAQYYKQYKQGLLHSGSDLAKIIHDFRQRKRKPDGTRYSYREASLFIQEFIQKQHDNANH